MDNIIKIDNLNYKNILDNLNLNIEKNTIVAISGTNKCGKTTLIKLLSGILDDNNQIIFNRAYLSSIIKSELYQKIGFVIPFIEPSFIFKSVEQELLFVLNNLGLDEVEKKSRLKEIVKLFKLRNYTLADPSMLEGPVKIKLLLALAVIHKPEIIFLDDICLTMTKEDTKEIFDIIFKLKEEENLTVVFTTTNLEQALEADYLYILDKGKNIIEGKPLEVFKEDSLLAKIGLEIPFMVDLSLKLKYYDLIDNIELDMDRLVNILWK